MPPYQSPGPQSPFTAIQANVPAFAFGSQSGPSTRMLISNVAGDGATATITVRVVEGNIPVVGQLVSIIGTAVDPLFNVTLASITGVSINATTGRGTIQFASSEVVASTPDGGTAWCPPAMTSELPVNGNSVAFTLQTLAGQDICWDLLFSGTPLSSILATLQGSVDPEFTNPSILDQTNVTTSIVRYVTNKQIPFMRVNLANVTGGDGTSGLVARLYVRYRGASS